MATVQCKSTSPGLVEANQVLWLLGRPCVEDVRGSTGRLLPTFSTQKANQQTLNLRIPGCGYSPGLRTFEVKRPTVSLGLKPNLVLKLQIQTLRKLARPSPQARQPPKIIASSAMHARQPEPKSVYLALCETSPSSPVTYIFGSWVVNNIGIM